MYKTYDLVLAMSLGWSLYGILNILNKKNKKEYNRKFAIAVILCMTIPIIDHLIKPTPNTYNSIYPLLVVTRNIYFIIGPLLLFYVTSLLSAKPTTNKVIFLHSIPFLVLVILSFKFQSFTIIHKINNARVHNINYLAIIRMFGSAISAIIYGIYSLKLINNHKKSGVNFYSNKKMTHTLSWLSILLLFMTVSYSFFLLLELLKLSVNIDLFRNPSQILTITPIIFLFFFSFYSTKQNIPDDIKSGYNHKKYQKSSIDKNEIEVLYSNIIKLFENKKLYLNPELTIEDISLELHTTKHKISQIINIKTDNNFYHFINIYRVKEFKLAIIEKKYPHYTIIDIAFECGFNSSSVFYSFFKKTEKTTPKVYINSVTKN